MNSICVFCGSSPGRNPAYAAAAKALGRTLAQKRLRLVFGGANVGLMGHLAQAALDAGGRVLGVIPRHLFDLGLAAENLDELRIVPDMHSRKAAMAREADAFLALPGGWGTLEELMEVLTWAQLGLHHKPCGLLNTARFFSPLLRFLDHTREEGFLSPDQRARLLVKEDPRLLLETLLNQSLPPPADKTVGLLEQLRQAPRS